MTPKQVHEALECATTEQLIAELTNRHTWCGVVIGSEHRDKWKSTRMFKFDFSKNHIGRKQAVSILRKSVAHLEVQE